MIVSILANTPREIVLQYNMELPGEDSDGFVRLKPGQRFFGRTFDELREAGVGLFEMPPPPPGTEDVSG